MAKVFVLLFCFLTAPAAFAQNEVIYQIYQRSFFDSNNDGNGDMEGIRLKLDYLQQLGVTTVQLAPVYQTGYEKPATQTNASKIAPEYGKFIDYRNLVQELHRRKMKLYQEIDVQVTAAGVKDPKVKEDALKMLAYWADPNGDGKFYDGADGFVFLAMAHKTADKKVNLLKEFWAPLLAGLKKINPALQIVAVPLNTNSFATAYFNAGASRVAASKFQKAIISFNAKAIISAADSTFNYLPEGKQPVVFVEGYDAERFAAVAANDAKKLRIGAVLTILAGGVPSVYYGQELGMGSNTVKDAAGNTTYTKEAFDWFTAEIGTGMAFWYKADTALWDTRSMKANDGISLEEEVKDENSLFNYYKKLLFYKRTDDAFSGVYQNIPNDSEKVFSFTRTSDKGTILVMINLSNNDEYTALENTGDLRVDKLKLMIGSPDVVFPRGGRATTLKPYAVQVWKVLH